MPALLAQPQNYSPQVTFQMVNHGYLQDTEEWIQPTTYDEIVQMLDDLESGELERRYSPMQLERVNEYLAFLAKEGILPNEYEEEETLEEDTYDLMYGEDSAFQLVHYLENSHEYMIIPAVINGYSGYNIIQCGKISKAWKKTKKFVKKHKKAIIIGAVVVVAVAVVAVAVVAVSSATVASAASAAASAAGAAISDSSPNSSSSGSTKSGPNEKLPSTSNRSETQTASNDIPIFTSAMEEQISSFKANLAQEQFFEPPHPNGQGLSLEKTGRVIGPLFAHESFNQFNNQFSNCPQFAEEIQSLSSQANFRLPPGAIQNPIDFGHQEIDRRFSTDYGPMFSNPAQEKDFNALSYQMRGEAARSYGYYGQAVNDFTKAIEMNPTNPTPYLQRSVSYFDMRQYERSFEDFHHYTTQTEQSPNEIPFSTPEFTLAFAKGLPKGVYESGKGIILFLGDFISHPVHTSTQIYEALSTLAKLAREDEWGVIGEVLSPEIYQLVTQWETLPSDRKGELAGYAFGKHGMDILAPGAMAKIASKSAKSARELAAVLKNLQRAEGTLVLETAVGVGNTAKLGEIISTGKQTTFLGEELGFTAKEMGQLQKAGKLEQAIDSTCESWLAKSSSEAYITAKNGGKHARLIELNEGKSVKEIQKSIKSYEKLIELHKDKIANPSKYCPGWDAMDPRRQNALINKRWPAEIQCFTEEKDILQTILEQLIES